MPHLSMIARRLAAFALLSAVAAANAPSLAAQSPTPPAASGGTAGRAFWGIPAAWPPKQTAAIPAAAVPAAAPIPAATIPIAPPATAATASQWGGLLPAPVVLVPLVEDPAAAGPVVEADFAYYAGADFESADFESGDFESGDSQVHDGAGELCDNPVGNWNSLGGEPFAGGPVVSRPIAGGTGHWGVSVPLAAAARPAPFPYGYFGASGARYWQRHFGFREAFTQWTLK